MKMRIEKLEIENFRKHERLSFALHDVCVIQGRNGQGKSSIAEAIVWLMTGTDVYGLTRQEGRLMRAGAEEAEMRVVAKCTMDDGTLFYVERSRIGGKTELKVNGKRAEQNVLNVYIGDPTTFLSAFLPGYFGSLEPKEGREVLMKLLPPLSLENIFQNMTEEEVELLREYGERELLVGLDKTMQRLRKDLSDLKIEIEQLTGRITEVKALSGESLLPEMPPIDHAKKIKELEEEILFLQSGAKGIEAEILKNTAKITELKADTQRMTLMNEIRSLEEKITSLLREANLLKAQKKPVPEGTCPTCRQKLPEAEVKKLVAEAETFNRDLAIQFQKIRTEGTELVQRKKMKEEELAKLPDVKGEIEVLQKKNEELKIRMKESLDEERIKALQKEIDRLRQEEKESLAKSLEVKTKNKTIIEARERAVKLFEELEAKQMLQTKIEATLQAMNSFRITMAEALITPLTRHLNRTVIKLFDVVESTGEIKPVFHLFWKNEEGLEIPYKSLSSSEKIRCHLEISRMISLVRGETYPVFVDGAESINDLLNEEFAGQLIAAYVSDTPLEIKSFSKIKIEKEGTGVVFQNRNGKREG